MGTLVRNYYMYLTSIHKQEVITRDRLHRPRCSRGHHGAPRQENAVRRRLRLSHLQLEQPRQDHLRQLCRARSESVGHGLHHGAIVTARQGRPYRARRKPPAAQRRSRT